MFGLDKLAKSVVKTVDEAVSDPIGFTVDTVTQPIVDTIDVLEGLTEGELREKAALRLGTDAVAGMATNELIEVILDQ